MHGHDLFWGHIDGPSHDSQWTLLARSYMYWSEACRHQIFPILFSLVQKNLLLLCRYWQRCRSWVIAAMCLQMDRKCPQVHSFAFLCTTLHPRWKLQWILIGKIGKINWTVQMILGQSCFKMVFTPWVEKSWLGWRRWRKVDFSQRNTDQLASIFHLKSIFAGMESRFLGEEIPSAGMRRVLQRLNAQDFWKQQTRRSRVFTPYKHYCEEYIIIWYILNMNCLLLKYSIHWLLPKKSRCENERMEVKMKNKTSIWNVARQWNVSTMGMKGKAENISLGEMCPGALASHSGTWMGRASIQQRLCLHDCKDTGMHVSCIVDQAVFTQLHGSYYRPT